MFTFRFEMKHNIYLFICLNLYAFSDCCFVFWILFRIFYFSMILSIYIWLCLWLCFLLVPLSYYLHYTLKPKYICTLKMQDSFAFFPNYQLSLIIWIKESNKSWIIFLHKHSKYTKVFAERVKMLTWMKRFYYKQHIDNFFSLNDNRLTL